MNIFLRTVWTGIENNQLYSVASTDKLPRANRLLALAKLAVSRHGSMVTGESLATHEYNATVSSELGGFLQAIERF